MIKLSKYLSRILRHTPEEIDLELDRYGWVDVDALLKACRQNGVAITRKKIEEIAAGTDKQRFEICRGKIRALHGHSVEVDPGEPEAPPEVLYHGTASRNLDRIFQQGLLPGNRQFVHLVEESQVAMNVATRHGGKAILLKIASGRMARNGFAFYRSSNGIWLTKEISAHFLRIDKEGNI